MTYDPAYAYELATIIKDGIKRMYVNQEDCFYYITVQNENYPMPSMPEGVEEGILKGMYRLRPSLNGEKAKAHLFGSGSIINETLNAQKLLAEDYGVASDQVIVASFYDDIINQFHEFCPEVAISLSSNKGTKLYLLSRVGLERLLPINSVIAQLPLKFSTPLGELSLIHI